MLSNELAVKQRNGNDPHVSIVVPLQDLPAQDKKAALLHLEKAIRKAEEFLQSMQQAQKEDMLASLHKLAAGFEKDYDPAARGIGLYVSREDSRLLLFPFPVEERICIGNTFAVREWLYLEHYSRGYFVLQLSEKGVQLYKGRLGRLEEIKDGRFPMRYHDNYEYSKPARKASAGGYEGVKSFEKDRSVIEALRLKRFYNGADQALTGYLGELPLVVAGPKKDMALLQEVTRHKKNIIAGINGNYSNMAIKTLEERTWPLITAWMEEREHDAVTELIAEKWQGHAVEGIQEVWRASGEGKGRKLVVEKDYACTAFLDEKSGRLRLKAGKAARRLLMDAVDDVMKIIKEKNGEVLFVKNGALNEHGHIALITRY